MSSSSQAGSKILSSALLNRQRLDPGSQLTSWHTVSVCGHYQQSETLAFFTGEPLCLQCAGKLLDDLPVGGQACL